MDKVDKIIAIIRHLKEEGMISPASAPTNNTSGPIAGFPPDSPPVYNKRKRYAYGGKGSRSNWLLKRNGSQI